MVVAEGGVGRLWLRLLRLTLAMEGMGMCVQSSGSCFVWYVMSDFDMVNCLVASLEPLIPRRASQAPIFGEEGRTSVPGFRRAETKMRRWLVRSSEPVQRSRVPKTGDCCEDGRR